MSKSDISSVSSASATQICSPGNLRGIRTNSTTVVLNWAEPYSTCNLCPDAMGYEISGDGIDTIDILRPPHELRELNPHVNYQICVRAKAAGNNISEPSYCDVLRSPGKPGNLRVTDVPPTGFTLTWSAHDGGEPVSNYEIRYPGEFCAFVSGLTYQLSSPTL